MPDSTTHLDTIIQGQGSQDIKANALFDALGQVSLYGRRSSTSSGVTWGYYGGKVRLAGGVNSISNGTLSLTQSATNYVQAHPDTGTISANTTAFTAGYLPLYTVVVGASTVTSYTDHRGATVLNDTLAKTLSDAAYTLTQAEAAPSVLTFTGTLTATRNITVPLVGKRQWTVYNGTGQSLQFIGATGTGVTVASGRRAVVYSDGTNVVRVTPDTLGTTPVTVTGNYTAVDSDQVVICNGTASITLTLPTASSWAGRIINIKTRAAYTVVSASSNVKPIDSDAAGTAILPATAGRWAILVSDGSNWIVMSQGGDDGEFVAPVTKTGNFTLAANEQFVVCNGSASITATLPSAAAFPGRRVVIKTIAAYTVISASSNVAPIDSATAGTAILAATAGKWAKLVSDGTNWVIMAAN